MTLEFGLFVIFLIIFVLIKFKDQLKIPSLNLHFLNNFKLPDLNLKDKTPILVPMFLTGSLLFIQHPEFYEWFYNQEKGFIVVIIAILILLVMNPIGLITKFFWAVFIIGLCLTLFDRLPPEKQELVRSFTPDWIENIGEPEDEIASFAEVPMTYQESKPVAQTVSPGVVKTTKGNTNTYTLTIGAGETKKVVVPEGNEVAIDNCPQSIIIKMVITESGKKAENFVVDC
mgnify:CR=1 FL=1